MSAVIPQNLILGFETSCDETAVALYDLEQGLIGQEIYSQIELHQLYGGVVPELAARDHIQYALPLLDKLLQAKQLKLQHIKGIAYTKGPGLIGALLVGATLAKSLAWALGIPSIGVHHMEAHLAAVMLEERTPTYPYLALLVSGGHTMLVEAKALGSYKILGQSVDDAAGEAFDKTAKLLGLGYPGGPAIAKLAASVQRDHYEFPRPMCRQPGLDFSFSGLKTKVSTVWASSDQSERTKSHIAHAFEVAAVDSLRIKVLRALKQTSLKQLVMVGGVSANRRLRACLAEAAGELGVEIFYPRPEYCTDNAAMVAYLGAQRLQAGQAEGLAIKAQARWSMQELTPLGND